MQSHTPATEPKNPLLSVDGLSCVRGENTLFQGLSLNVNAKQCLHIVGANGSGKSSLLRLLCGLNKAEQGQILWKDVNIGLSDTYFHECAYIGHKDGLKNELTALENLAFQQRLEQTYNEDQLDDVLAKLKILQCADLPAQVLSFGQRRRLAFAKLLLTRKQLWILDEPFTGIDAAGRDLIEQLCIDHLEQDGAIVLSHHQSLQSSPLNEYTSQLQLEAFNTIDEPSLSQSHRPESVS